MNRRIASSKSKTRPESRCPRSMSMFRYTSTQGLLRSRSTGFSPAWPATCTGANEVVATPRDVVGAAGLALRMQQALPPLPVSRPEAKRAASASVDVVYDALVTDAGLIAATQALFKN